MSPLGANPRGRLNLDAQGARALGGRICSLVAARETVEAYRLLAPVLAERTPFPLLGRVGEAIGAGPLSAVNAFLEEVAVKRTEGGWVVIGAALGRQLDRDPAGALARCRALVIAGDIWYAADILAERVPGPALVSGFEQSLLLLEPWREDASHWVRRTVGVAVHYWARRSQGEQPTRALAALAFLERTFEERDMDAVKGLGWGLKTLGQYYPALVTEWLAREVVYLKRPHRALMLRKALTYLSEEQRARATGGAQ